MCAVAVTPCPLAAVIRKGGAVAERVAMMEVAGVRVLQPIPRVFQILGL